MAGRLGILTAVLLAVLVLGFPTACAIGEQSGVPDEINKHSMISIWPRD